MENATEDFTDVVQRYSDTVWRVCALFFSQAADVEDAFQETFVRYATAQADFESEEHRKAWLIRVATNICKDILKSATHQTALTDTFDEEQTPLFISPEKAVEHSAIFDALNTLPDRYRIVLYLTYYEGYPASEIADMLELPVNTVYTNIARGKKMLKEVLSDGR